MTSGIEMYAHRGWNYASQLIGTAYEKAKKFVSVEPTDPNKDYAFEAPTGSVVLRGDAKTWGVQKIVLEKEKERFSRIFTVCTNVFGVVWYHKGWWDHNLLSAFFTIPIVYGCNVVRASVEQTYNDQIDVLKHKISDAIKHT